MIKKIVFFRYLPLTKKVFSDFYLEELSNAGFVVEYWYLPFIICVPKGVEDYNHSFVRRLYSYKELNLALKKEDKETALFVSIQTYGWPTLHLFWVMSRNHCRLSVFGKNTLPIFEYKSNTSKLSHYSFSDIKKAIKNRIANYLKKIGFIKSYDVIFLAGENGINGYGGKSNYELFQSKHILVNSDDYDRALLKTNGLRIISEKYIVFLDECIPLHPDKEICGVKVIAADIYYKEINVFFDKIEEETGYSVVIAAHPKALVYNEKDYFNGRKVIFGKTAELVRDSELVLAHDSTAIGYVVFFNKPLISITSDKLEKEQPTNHHTILGSSMFLGSKLIYVNRYVENSEHLNLKNYKINKERYSKYKYQFLTNPGTQTKQSSKLIIEGLKKL